MPGLLTENQTISVVTQIRVKQRVFAKQCKARRANLGVRLAGANQRHWDLFRKSRSLFLDQVQKLSGLAENIQSAAYNTVGFVSATSPVNCRSSASYHAELGDVERAVAVDIRERPHMLQSRFVELKLLKELNNDRTL